MGEEWNGQFLQTSVGELQAKNVNLNWGEGYKANYLATLHDKKKSNIKFLILIFFRAP